MRCAGGGGGDNSLKAYRGGERKERDDYSRDSTAETVGGGERFEGFAPASFAISATLIHPASPAHQKANDQQKKSLRILKVNVRLWMKGQNLPLD